MAADGSIRIEAHIETAQLKKDTQGLYKELDAVQKKADQTAQKLRKLAPSDAYSALLKQLQEAENKYASLQAQIEKMQAAGGNTSGLVSQLQAVSTEIDNITSKMAAMETNGSAYANPGDFVTGSRLISEYAAYGREMQSIMEQIAQKESQLRSFEEVNAERSINAWSRVAAAIRSFGQQVGSVTKSVTGRLRSFFTSLTSAIKNFKMHLPGLGNGFSSLFGKIMALGASISVFSLISKALRSMVTEAGNAFKEYLTHDAALKNSVNELKTACSNVSGALVSAFAPILSAVIPIISQLVSWISAAINALGAFFAMLGGKSSYKVLVANNKAATAAITKTGKAAKKTEQNLADWDELSILNKKQDEDDMGGGGGGGGAAPGYSWKEIPIDTSKWKWLSDLIDKIKARLKELWEIFKEGFAYGLGDWDTRWADLLQGLQRIKTALIDIFTDPQVLASMNAWLESFVFMLGTLVGAAASIALTIATALIGGLGIYMMEHTEEIKSYLISMFDIGTEINYLIADFAAAFANVFSAFAGENGQEAVANLIAMFATCFGTITELVARFGRDVLTLLFQPFIDNQEGFKAAIDGTLGVFSTALEAIESVLDPLGQHLLDVYDNHIKPFFENTTESISGLVEQILAFYNETFLPFMQNIAEQLGPFLSTYIQPLATAIFDFIGSVADLLNKLLNNVLIPLFSWIVAHAEPVVMPILEALLNGFSNFVAFIATAATALIETLTAIIDFIVDVFEVGWDEAWATMFSTLQEIWTTFIETATEIAEQVKADWDTFWEEISSVLTTVWNSMQSAVTTIFTAIQTFINTTLTTIKAKWEEIWNALKTFVEPIWTWFQTTVEDIFTKIQNTITEVLDAVHEKWTDVWQAIADWVKEKVNEIIDFINEMLEALENGINKCIDMINSLGFDVPEWVPKIGGDHVGFGLDHVSLGSITPLANGAVIRGGDPFVAMLGDQPSGQTNIETPLDTMIEAMQTALSETGGGGINTVIMNMDGETIAEAIIDPFIAAIQRRGITPDIMFGTS